MANQTKATNNDADEIYHDPLKQERIIGAFNNEIAELRQKKARLADQLKELKDEEVKETEEEKASFDRLKELNDSIPQQKTKIAQLDKELIDVVKQQLKLERSRIERRQKFEEMQNEIEAQGKFSEKFNEEINSLDDESFNLEQRKGVLESAKTNVESKLTELVTSMKQSEDQVSKLKQRITKLEGKIRNNDLLLKDLQANVDSKEDVTRPLQREIVENNSSLSNFSKESIQLNEDLIRMKVLIDQISLIIEMKEKNPNQLGQFKNNIEHDLSQAQKELKAIQDEIQNLITKINEIEKSIQLLTETLTKSVKELNQLENQERELTESIEQGEQVLEKKEEHVIRLNGEKEFIHPGIEFEQEEANDVAQFEKNVKDFNDKEHNLKTKLKELEDPLSKVETDRNSYVEEIKRRKDLIKQCQSDLFTTKENRITIEEHLRQQEQVIQNAQEQLLKCQSKEPELYQAMENVKLEVKAAKENFELAKELFEEAKTISECLSKYIKANPQVKVVGVATKEKLIEKYKQAFETSQIELNRKENLLSKRINDFDKFKSKMNEIKKSLETETEKFQQQTADLQHVQEKNFNIWEEIHQLTNEIDDIKEKCNPLQEKSEEIQNDIYQIKKDILSIEQERFKDEQELQCIKTNINIRKTKQEYYIQLIKKTNNDLIQSRTDLDEKIKKKQILQEQIIEKKAEQNTLIRTIEKNRQKIETIQLQLNSQWQQEHRTKGKIINLQEIQKLADRNIADLKSQLNEQKILHGQRETQQAKVDHELKYVETKKKDLDKNMQTLQDNRDKFRRNLEMQYRESVQTKLEYSLLKCNEDPYQILLKLDRIEYDQYKEQHSKLIKLLEEYENDIKLKQTKITQTREKINSRKYIHIELLDEETITKIEKQIDDIDTAIFELLLQYRAEKDRQDSTFIDIRLIYDLKMNFIKKYIAYKTCLVDYELKTNKLHYKIVSTENKLRNYQELQDRYQHDLYAALLK